MWEWNRMEWNLMGVDPPQTNKKEKNNKIIIRTNNKQKQKKSIISSNHTYNTIQLHSYLGVMKGSQ